MMAVVLGVNRFARLVPFTGAIAGLLVALYIAFEAPLSGMSLNPARSLASALPAHRFTAMWVYFTAPVLGMLAAVELHRHIGARRHRLCGKLTHSKTVRCVFRCDCA